MTRRSADNRSALIIFVKNPILGKVKTRLAKTLGADQALLIYQKLLVHTRKVALNSNIELHLFYSDYVENDNWSDEFFNKHVQDGDDLGLRMYSAFEKILKTAQKAIIIGSDCPELSSDHITQAVELLNENDLVIGPSVDGGYYLLGLKSLYMQLFTNIEWSSDKVFLQTLRAAQTLDLKLHLLEQLSDIDIAEDWVAYQEKKSQL